MSKNLKTQWRKHLELTQDRLKELLSFDEWTGHFTWLVNRWGHARSGDRAGSVHKKHLYCRIKIGGKDYHAHRLAWLYVHGVWPSGEIDHINGDRQDNRLANLRDVSASLNQQNRRTPGKNNTSGYLGVSRTGSGKFKAELSLNRKRVHIGSFDTPEQAHVAYIETKRQLHTGNTL